jgi:transcriptional regulator of acetoin/glycerol metabolism
MFASEMPVNAPAVGTLSADSQRMLIESSWQRSSRYGLRGHESQDFQALPVTDLRLLREQHQELMQHAAPVMETLHQQIIDTESMVVLTDAQGVVLHSLGDDSFDQRASQVALRPGVNWSEAQKGTNAIGTAIFEKQPVVVHGDQHFLRANHGLTCSASPIFAPAGDLLGVLDVTGDYRGFHKHTMGLVRMSAQMIENTFFRRIYAGQLIVAFHARAEFIGTLMEGLLAFAPDGKVLGANRSACLQLELSRASLGTHTALSLLRRGPSELHELATLAVSAPLQCVLPSGVRIYAVPTALTSRPVVVTRPGENKVHGQAATVADSADKSSRAARTRPQGVRHDSLPQATLDHLDSGDVQIAKAVSRLRRVAATDVSVLLEAETGAGKEWFSLAIHRASPRRDGPFIAVNCAAIPEGLIESELFGYEEGAFTGARRKGHQGKILQAHGGTLFLDEIGDMPLAMQARLLRVLQERVVTPLGSGTSIPVDVRLVCATHQRLRELIGQKAFRDDLYYRLNGLTVRLPPLRDRSDVREIVARLLHAQAGPEWTLSPDVWQLMLRHPWPGNLRQLSNVLATAIAIAAPGTQICAEHLPDDFLDDLESPIRPAVVVADTAAGVDRIDHCGAQQSLDAVATDAMQRALARHRGNVSAAARELGVSRNTLYRKLPGSQLRPPPV